jgi:hypothetical protein
VRAPGFVAEHSTRAAVESEVVVRLERAHEIRGRVLGPDGRPSGGVHVSAGGRPNGTSALAAADGTFRLRGLAPGTWRLEVHADGRPAGVSAEVAAGASDVDLRLPDAAPQVARDLRVIVLDGEGRRVPRAQVRLDGRASPGGPRNASAPVVDGEAVLRFPHGRAEGVLRVFRAEDAEGRAVGAAVRLEGVEPDRAEALVLLRPPRSLRGRVLDARGEAVRGVRLVALVPSRPPEARDRSLDVVQVSSAWTDAAGGFDLDALGDEPIDLRVDPGRAFVDVPLRRVEAAESSLELRLRDTVAPFVRVTDDDGRPVPGARVSAVRDEAGARSAHDTTGVAGLARLAGLDPEATYRLRAHVPAAPDGFLPFPDVARWTPREDEVRLVRARSVRGVVRDAAGEPAGHARVEWEAPERYGNLRSGADGTFEVGRLPAGPVRFRALGEGEAGTHPWTTANARDRDVALRLPAGGSIRVSPDGEPWPNRGRAALYRVAEDGAWAHVADREATPEGAAFHALPPQGAYVLFVQDVGGDVDSVALLEGLSAPATVRAALKPTVAARVRLETPEGARGALVEARFGGGASLSVRESQGVFLVRGLPEGRVARVTATVRAGEKTLLARGEVRPGEEIVLRPSPE